MVSTRHQLRIDHPIIITFLIFAVIAFMSAAAEVLKPLALAILLSFALAPLTIRVERFGLPRAAAVLLTVIATLSVLGGVVYVVETQLVSLAAELPNNQDRIERKLSWFKSNENSAINQVKKVATDVATKFDHEEANRSAIARKSAEKDAPSTVTPESDAPNVVDVRVIDQASYRERLQNVIGPVLEPLAAGSFVLILVLFMLTGRDDLADRITSLFGRGRVSVTTRTMEEVTARISRYLATWSLVNSLFGVTIGTGLAIIGVPYAVLWGFLAAGLRFIPYVGAAVAFTLPFVFSIAHFEGWREPLLVFTMFAIIETVANSFLEPVIYGKTTGVSALGLLVAAMFWTWLWGSLGLLLSTPLTVCLAVLGKYVPSLGVFSILLAEEPQLGSDIKLYQRLLALDEEGAAALIDEALAKQSRVDVFDTLLVPTLVNAERDRARNEIDPNIQAFIWRVIGDMLTDLEDTPDPLVSAMPELDLSEARITGIATNDLADQLVLRMLGLALMPSHGHIKILESTTSPLRLAEEVAGDLPDAVILSHLPPEGLTPARYLVRRLRARLANLPILVGRWGETLDTETSAKKLTEAGATSVSLKVADVRDRLLTLLGPHQSSAHPDAVPLPEDRVTAAV